MLKRIGEEVWRFSPPIASELHLGVVAGLHGDESAPVALIRALSQADHPFWSACTHTVTLAIANPLAVAAASRTAPGQEDLNRAFANTAKAGPETRQRVLELKEAFHNVHKLLDLHQSHRPIAPCAVCPDEPEHLSLAQSLGAELAVSGAKAFLGGGMLIDWANEKGIVALSLECGQIGDKGALGVAESAVQVFLHLREPSRNALEHWRIVERLQAPGPKTTWLVERTNGSRVRAGEVLANSKKGALIASRNGAVFLPQNAEHEGGFYGLLAAAANP